MFGFVTGASSGVGEAFACRLAADGWDLATTARRGDRLTALAQRLTGKYGVSVQVHVADLADPGDVAELERVVAAAEPEFHAVAGMDLAGIPFPVLRPDEVTGARAGGTGPGRGCLRPGSARAVHDRHLQRSAAGAGHDRGEFGAGRPPCAGSRGVTGS